jgi:hypothetical protein
MPVAQLDQEQERQLVLDLKGRIGIKLADAALDLDWLASLYGRDSTEGQVAKRHAHTLRYLLSEWQARA